MKFRILLMIFIITLTIGGCKQAEPQSSVQSETPSASVQAEASPPPVQSEAPPSPAPTVYVDSTKENFHIAIATEELLGKYESYHEYASDELERIIIWTDTIVKDFDFTTVKYDDTGDEFTFSEGDVLFSLDEFTPDKPFVADIFSPEIFPVNGISFRDVYGVRRYFFIQADGRGIEEAPPYHFREFENEGLLLTEAETVPLTAEELAVYNEIFEYQVYDDEGNPVSGTGSKPINQFLTSNYSRPQDINLVRLLWYFPCDGLVTDEAEFETLKDAENWTFEGCATLDRVPVPIHRTSADSVNKALVKYMGISLEDHSGVGTEKLTYLKAADSYYTYASDCSGACFIAVSGERQGELVRLYSENAVLTLMLQGDRFLFVSHLLTGEPSESGLTLTDITESSSVICMGKIIDGRAVDKNMKAFNIAVTSELKGAAEGTRIEIHTQKSFQAGSIYIFFLAKGKDSIEYDLLSIASYNEHDGKISYDEALILDVGYENIDKIDELYEYIQR